jgi:hypothetical protein
MLFEIQCNALDLQLGGVLMQDCKPLSFFSRKLLGAQLNYTMMEKEMLAIVELLKELCCWAYLVIIKLTIDGLNS